MKTSIELTGTITECTTGPAPVCEKVVYQRVAPGKGNLNWYPLRNRQRRRWVKPIDPRTPAQLARRARFAAAVAAWQALPQSTKDAWLKAGRNRRLPGYQMFLSDYMRK